MRTCVYGRYAPVQPIINLQSFKSTPDSLKQRFKAFGRKPSLGAPGPLPITGSEIATSWSPMRVKIECWRPEFQG